MSIYLDSSALVKLVVQEPETQALRAFLADDSDGRWTTSALARTEVIRAVRLEGPPANTRARELLATLAQTAVRDTVLDAAADLTAEPSLRSLDAIHVATAQTVPALQALVTYDVRIRRAAEAVGLPVVSPS